MRNRRIARLVTICLSAFCAFAYACVAAEEETSVGEQAGSNLNGSNLNGSNLNGSNLNGMSLLGMMAGGATLNGNDVMNLHVDKGELVGDQGGTTLRGDQLEGMHLVGLARDRSTNPPTYAYVDYRIIEIDPEAGYDPTNTGSTFRYKLEQWNTTTSAWVLACPADADGNSVAIPLAAEWDETGARTDSPNMFTLACTSGAIGKCYRWGYRPWVTGYGDLATMHWTCTRLARADYCGNGVSFTQDGRLINVWDILPPPGPIQTYGPPGTFDAGWNTAGAVCMSDAAWTALGASITAMCPTKLVSPSQGGTACNSQAAVLAIDPNVKMFREVYSAY
jgi:hypothetical protein